MGCSFLAVILLGSKERCKMLHGNAVFNMRFVLFKTKRPITQRIVLQVIVVHLQLKMVKR